MNKILMSISIIAICAMALDISMLNVQNQRLKNRVADANLKSDLVISDPPLVAQIASDQRTIDDLKTTLNGVLKEWGEFSQKHYQPITAVNEKKGAHNFMYVQADSWVDTSTLEIVPAFKNASTPKEVDPNPKERWSGRLTNMPLTSLTLYRDPLLLGDSTHRWIAGPPTFHYLYFTNAISTDLGTGGWNR